jgi:hypothetical protein
MVAVAAVAVALGAGAMGSRSAAYRALADQHRVAALQCASQAHMMDTRLRRRTDLTPEASRAMADDLRQVRATADYHARV